MAPRPRLFDPDRLLETATVWDRVDGFQGLVSDITLDGILPEKLCIRVATFPDHTLESLDSGNCIPIVNNS
jgi:hypothetical protein